MAHPPKAQLLAKMLALETEALQTAREHYEDYLKDSRLAANEPHERDEMAAARMAADLAHAFDDPIHDHEAKIAALKAMEFEDMDEVGPGAVVTLNGKNFVVAVATRRFESGGETYMGISRDSPIYKKMAGMTRGDTFVMNGVKMEIEDLS